MTVEELEERLRGKYVWFAKPVRVASWGATIDYVDVKVRVLEVIGGGEYLLVAEEFPKKDKTEVYPIKIADVFKLEE